MSRKFVLTTLLLLLPSLMPAQSLAQANQDTGQGRRLWITSLAVMAAASAFDAGTSWGRPEANGILASSNGTFGGRAVSLKVAITAAALVPQIVMRHHADWRRRATLTNFIASGVYGGVAVYNTRVP